METQSSFTNSYARTIDSVLLSSLKALVHHALSDAESSSRRVEAAKAELDVYKATVTSLGGSSRSGPNTERNSAAAAATAAARGFAAHLSRAAATATSSASNAAAVMSEAATSVNHATSSFIHVPELPGFAQPMGHAMMNVIGALNPANALKHIPRKSIFVSNDMKSEEGASPESSDQRTEYGKPATSNIGNNPSAHKEVSESNYEPKLDLKDAAEKSNDPLGELRDDPHAQALLSKHFQLASAATSKVTMLAEKCAADIPSQMNSMRRAICLHALQVLKLYGDANETNSHEIMIGGAKLELPADLPLATLKRASSVSKARPAR